MKKTVLLSLLALSAHVFADGEIAITDHMQQMQQDQMTPVRKKDRGKVNNTMNEAILLPARPESDNGWYLFADALYWHAAVGSTDWAVKYPDRQILLVDYNRPVDVHSLNFKWAWGFKVGLGANINHDMWDTNFYYTWFHTHNSNSAGTSLEGWVADNIGDLNTFSGGHVDWDVHFSMFDWELGVWCYVRKNLALRPHIGVKGGWINQRIKQHLTDVGVGIPDFFPSPTGFVLRTKFENNFWGVGPSLGVNTLWILGKAGSVSQHQFSLFGDFGGALMYGHFTNKHRENLLNRPGVHGFHMNGLSRNLAVTMLQGAMGLSWDAAFNRNRNHFTMKVGYELQYWFRQNQFVDVITIGGQMQRITDDLSLQGITAEFRFDF